MQRVSTLAPSTGAVGGKAKFQTEIVTDTVIEGEVAGAGVMNGTAAYARPTGSCGPCEKPKPVVCEDPCKPKCVDACGNPVVASPWGAWSWASLILWFIVFTILFWLGLYALRPVGLQNADGTVNVGKALLAAVILAIVLTLIVAFIMWLTMY